MQYWKIIIPFTLFFLIALPSTMLKAEDGYKLWLAYKKIEDPVHLKRVNAAFSHLVLSDGKSKTLSIAENEIIRALKSLTGKSISAGNGPTKGAIVFITPASPSADIPAGLNLNEFGDEGFGIQTTTIRGKSCTVIAARTDIGILYGTFHLLRVIQNPGFALPLNIKSKPAIRHRILNHWDNLDRTVERGYAGFSLWDWHRLPDHIDPRYYDYARANASIGINGVVLTNVNANAQILTPMYLEKVAALANIFRHYGIKVYLTARFSAPSEIGGLQTADPLDAGVNAWWSDKVNEIYRYVPDFGGFTVKANSEGQPGPQNYKRTHANGANMLAKALAPHNGIVMWRAFVYDNEVPTDRVKQAYSEFKPLDGKFEKNVIIQVKNGPLDFQPREPFHPLFGAMEKTPIMMEFQLTQEYLGFATHLVYLGTLFEECLKSDTWQKGKGSTVAKVIDGSMYHHSLSAIAGVTNIGNDRNWCGHPFAQSNWYAFGRLAWNPNTDDEIIADEWMNQTFPEADRDLVVSIMLRSRETAVKYMTPLGLHHIMGWNHHYGPAPWIRNKQRADWTSVYYHRADSLGIGFDRTTKGSNALEQYAPEVRKQFEDPATCPDEYLLWFHHLPWDYKMKSGKTLWNELCLQYNLGVDQANEMYTTWLKQKGRVNSEQFEEVRSLLNIQRNEAEWWRDACLSYFQTFSKRPLPEGVPKPKHSLEYYMSLEFPFAPGIRPKW
jgi:alpha-glucuronidase